MFEDQVWSQRWGRNPRGPEHGAEPIQGFLNPDEPYVIGCQTRRPRVALDTWALALWVSRVSRPAPSLCPHSALRGGACGSLRLSGSGLMHLEHGLCPRRAPHPHPILGLRAEFTRSESRHEPLQGTRHLSVARLTWSGRSCG